MQLRDTESEIATAETTSALWEALRVYFQGSVVREAGLSAPAAARRP